jgi:protocatechuate 3,4-dioxygenase beta subunit
VAAPACVITSQHTEGPYFVDERLNRSDIRSDPSDGTLVDGVPLRLVLQVAQVTASACSPLVGAQVDLWQCDALGNYSDEHDMSGLFDTVGKKFLRGYQITDADGAVQFMTIYPGWYPGRTVHIHFKVRTAPDSQSGHGLTSQFYFDDALTDQVHAQPPYAAKGQRTLRNAQDGIFRNGGSQLILPLVQEAEGYAATFQLGLQMS